MRNQLIVPISVEAWVVNQKVLTADPAFPQKNFRRWSLDYNMLELYSTPMPGPFSGEDPFFQTPDQSQGVYLHWTLPKGLRHAQHDETKNAMTFPPLPNRWLITRYYGPKTKRAVNAWVIESDYFGSLATSSYPDPTRTGGTLIGRCTPLKDCKPSSPSNYLPDPLTAVSSGDIHFLAYQRYNENVFSFHDNLSENPTETLSYSITGWYATLEQDPLAAWDAEKDSFEAWIKKYQWQITAEDKSQGAHRSLYQGRVWGIAWALAGDAPVSPETPDSKNLQVAVGANGLEALAALVTQNNPGLIPPELFKALNNGLLEKLEDSDGLEDIQQHAHRSEFASHTGKFTWAVCSTGKEDSDFEASALSLSLDQAKLLDKLNSQQADLNTHQQLLTSLQWNLYALWWKRGAAKGLRHLPSDEAFAKKIKALQQQISDQTKTCQQSSKQLASTQDALTQSIQPKGLKKRMRPRFWRPQDPVILVTGVIPPKYVPDDQLLCRYNNQIITGIADDKITVTSDIVNTAVSPVDLSTLPGDIQSSLQQLLVEGCLLDPTNADSLALLASADVGKLTSIMQGHNPQFFQGQLPVHGLSAWIQPWSPLFCEWQVEWYSLAFPNWSFNQQGDHAYRLQKVPEAKVLKSQSLGGHSLMTAQVNFALKGQLKRILQQDPVLQKKFPQWKNLLQIIDDWPVVSLTLSGFHDELAQRDADMNRIPQQEDKNEQPIRQSVDDQCHSTPLPGPVPQSLQPPPSDFQAARHGQFYLTGLSILDSFGQAIDIISPDSKDQQDALNFKPILSDTLKPDVDSEKNLLTVCPQEPLRFIQLTPRIIQNTRLDVDWVSAQDDKQRLLTSCQQNPIAGWLLPNYLEQAIQVYDPQGYCLGELQKTISKKNPLVWQPYPLASKTYPDLDSIAIDYPLLGKMLLALNPSNYDELNEVLDLALSSKVAPNSQYAHYTAALIGRPIALARSRWQLQLEQPAYQDQSWRYTLKSPAPDAFSTYDFPIKLGNVQLNKDGLIGYFTDSNFNQLYSDFEPDHPSYVHSNYVFTLKPQNPDIDLPQMTTVLMEPLSAIHAYSDILPMHAHSLPGVYVKSALNHILVTFKLGPLLTTPQLNPSLPTQPTSLRLFKPSVKGQWSWYDRQLDEKGKMRWQPLSIQTADKVPKFDNTPTLITEGLLQLSQINFQSASPTLPGRESPRVTASLPFFKNPKKEHKYEQKAKPQGKEKSGPGLMSLLSSSQKTAGRSEKSISTGVQTQRTKK